MPSESEKAQKREKQRNQKIRICCCCFQEPSLKRNCDLTIAAPERTDRVWLSLAEAHRAPGEHSVRRLMECTRRSMTNNSKLVAKIITDTEAEHYGILEPEITGDVAVQACKVDVLEPEREVVHHLIAMGHYPEMDRSLCEQIGTRLRDYFGKIVVSFTVRDKPGRSDIYIPSRQRGYCSLLSVAVAVAVVKRSWGWDESEWIEIRFEHTKEQMKVSPEYEEGEWVIETYQKGAA